MTTQPISSSNSVTSPGLTSLGGSAPLSISGLASGLDDSQIIQAILAIDAGPLNQMTAEQTTLNALNTQLTNLQSALETVSLNAQALESPGLFSDTQQINSSDPTMVTATGPASGVGAVIGSYELSVSRMASAAQTSYTWNGTASGDTIQIGGETYTLAAGASIDDLVDQVNADSNSSVWAVATNSNTIVFSSRTTGYQDGATISVTDSGGTLTEIQGSAKTGQDMAYTLDGVSGTSPTNTISGSSGATQSIAGVTLTVNGLSSSPTTITVDPPAPDTDAIDAAVNTFVSSYNAVISQIDAQLTQATISTDPTQGVLFGDQEFSDLLSNMRVSMYTPGTDASGNPLPAGMASLMDIGISTGATTGGAAYSQSAVNGDLTVDTSALNAAIESNPQGVEQVLQSWAQSFSTIVDDVAGPGGSISSRIEGDDSELSNLQDQISNLQENLADQQAQLTQEYANMETTLAGYQSQSSWLSGQIAQLPGMSSSSSSSS